MRAFCLGNSAPERLTSVLKTAVSCRSPYGVRSTDVLGRTFLIRTVLSTTGIIFGRPPLVDIPQMPSNEEPRQRSRLYYLQPSELRIWPKDTKLLQASGQPPTAIQSAISWSDMGDTLYLGLLGGDIPCPSWEEPPVPRSHRFDETRDSQQP